MSKERAFSIQRTLVSSPRVSYITHSTWYGVFHIFYAFPSLLPELILNRPRCFWPQLCIYYLLLCLFRLEQHPLPLHVRGKSLIFAFVIWLVNFSLIPLRGYGCGQKEESEEWWFM